MAEKESKKLLIVVDMQTDFITGVLGTPEAAAVLPNVRARVAVARAGGERVVFTRDTQEPDYLSTQEGKRLPVPHCIRGEAGWQIAAGLVTEGDLCFDKPCFGSVLLAQYAAEQKFAEAELIGVCTDICVISNALLLKAFCPEMRVCVRADCCAGVTPAAHETALAAMRACQVDIL